MHIFRFLFEGPHLAFVEMHSLATLFILNAAVHFQLLLCRYLIGAYQGEAIYRVCEVREVVSAAKPYRLPGSDKGSTLVMLKVRTTSIY